MRKRQKEKLIQVLLVIITFVMTILRFLLNEKGRVTPDSIRFMRQARLFPVIDNTTAPLGYPLSIKFFSFFGADEFWSSKIVAVASLIFIWIFSWKKQFYFREILMTTTLFSFVSIFSYTISEAFFLPFVIMFLYFSRQVIIGEFGRKKAVFWMAFLLILMLNIRYSALFFVFATFIFGIINLKKNYGKLFISAALFSGIYVVAYKVFFIDYFNQNYVKNFLEIGLKPFSQLSAEFFAGLFTTFNPFIHITKPGAGTINLIILLVGAVNILSVIFIFIKNYLSESEEFLLICGATGILCSFCIQFFYQTDALDYRLLTPFSFPIWLVYFKKLIRIFKNYTYILPLMSLATGFAFTILSRGNYLRNRSEAREFLRSENLLNKPLLFFSQNYGDSDGVQVAELLSTVNPNIKFTAKASDTLKPNGLTKAKVLKKIKIDTNKFQ